jgi:Flp pilus assembly protein TadG
MRMRPISSHSGAFRLRRLGADRRGVAALEFALIAPTLMVLVLGVFEMSLRFRAKEETTRYSHLMSDLISREQTLTTAELRSYYNASTNLMRPLQTSGGVLQLDVSSIGFNADGDAVVLWRRLVGTDNVVNDVAIHLPDFDDLGTESESIIRVGVRYTYTSPLTALFGGAVATITQEAIARPREALKITLDGAPTRDNGATQLVN